MKIFAGIFLLVAAGCGSTTYQVVESAPNIISRDSLNNSVHIVTARPITHAGKILSSGNYLYINEPYEGWHVIDNTTPASPKNVGFITAPGSLTGTVANGYLYITNSIDLVTLNISNLAQPVLVSRVQNAVGQPPSPHRPVGYYSSQDIIVNWHDTTTTEVTYYGPY